MTAVGVMPATPAAAQGYAGGVTRTLAFTIDAAAINLAAFAVAGIALLMDSILHLPSELDPVAAAIGAVSYVAWTVAYFASFWAGTGQTPGARVMGIRVESAATGGHLRPRVAVRRFLGMVLAFLPLGLGFLPVLTDERKRGLHDRLAGTVVRYAPRPQRSPG